ncbi:MAG TPA: Si-specific NAD(P)(+) transhydrogenase [Chloroflexota bacterium]|nr:Si-specific NAD(P)(+) transhydrogenase [Chloroflexota bacterium]
MTQPADAYDLVVIGSGPAGEKGAAQVAYFGKRVALIERAPEVGGAGVNTGTLPSKTLRETALYLSGARTRGLYGVEQKLDHEIRVDDLLYRLHHVVETQQRTVAANLERHKIDLIHGTARFVDANTVEVELSRGGTRRLTAPFFLVATGSRPHRPGDVPFDGERVHDSDSILSLHFVPKSLAVIGAGVIGSEYASIFATLGVRTTLIDARPELMPHLDVEISDRMRRTFAEKLGMELRLGAGVERYERRAESIVVHLQDGSAVESDALLFAGGRQGNTDGLGLEALGIEVNRRGQIAVNEHYQTAVPHIYAAGDVVGFPALAATSMEQARVGMSHAFELRYKERVSPVLPYGLYTVPEVGMVGETEHALKQKGIDCEIGVASYAGNTRGQIVGDVEGLVKLVFDPATQRLLGAHVIGESATELIHVASTCMTLGGTLDYFIQAVFNYPTLTDAYKYAAYDGLGRLARRPKMV